MAQPIVGVPKEQIAPLEAEATLPNKAGLHARSAAMVVRAASGFQSSITLGVEGRHAGARSLIELLRLGARQGQVVRIRAEGRDAEDALHAIKRLIELGFDEE